MTIARKLATLLLAGVLVFSLTPIASFATATSETPDGDQTTQPTSEVEGQESAGSESSMNGDMPTAGGDEPDSTTTGSGEPDGTPADNEADGTTNDAANNTPDASHPRRFLTDNDPLPLQLYSSTSSSSRS